MIAAELDELTTSERAAWLRVQEVEKVYKEACAKWYELSEKLRVAMHEAEIQSEVKRRLAREVGSV